VLNVLRFSIAQRKGMLSDRISFKVHVQDGPGPGQDIDLYALCGPGDSAEPVITILLPHED